MDLNRSSHRMLGFDTKSRKFLMKLELDSTLNLQVLVSLPMIETTEKHHRVRWILLYLGFPFSDIPFLLKGLLN